MDAPTSRKFAMRGSQVGPLLAGPIAFRFRRPFLNSCGSLLGSKHQNKHQKKKADTSLLPSLVSHEVQYPALSSTTGPPGLLEA